MMLVKPEKSYAYIMLPNVSYDMDYMHIKGILVIMVIIHIQTYVCFRGFL